MSDYGEMEKFCVHYAMQCEACGGEGVYYPWEDDPLAYDQDETKPCSDCDGTGVMGDDDGQG